MVIRYLRRTPKRPARVAAEMAVQRRAAPLVMPEEQVVMARALAYFCVACGRDHASGEVREADICCAEMKIKAVVNGEQP
jgi:hypothetical protein